MNENRIQDHPEPRRYSICVSSDEVQAIDPALGDPFHCSNPSDPERMNLIFLFGEYTAAAFAEENEQYDLGLDLRWSLARSFHANDDYRSPLLVLRANHDYIYARPEAKDPPNEQAIQTYCLKVLTNRPAETSFAGAAAAAAPVSELSLEAADFLMEVAERQHRYHHGRLSVELIFAVAAERGIAAADLRRPEK